MHSHHLHCPQVSALGQSPPHRRGRQRQRSSLPNPPGQPLRAAPGRPARGVRVRRAQHVALLRGPGRPAHQAGQRAHLLRRRGPEQVWGDRHHREGPQLRLEGQGGLLLLRQEAVCQQLARCVCSLVALGCARSAWGEEGSVGVELCVFMRQSASSCIA